jgi:hypothetical protein
LLEESRRLLDVIAPIADVFVNASTPRFTVGTIGPNVESGGISRPRVSVLVRMMPRVNRHDAEQTDSDQVEQPFLGRRVAAPPLPIILEHVCQHCDFESGFLCLGVDNVR